MEQQEQLQLIEDVCLSVCWHLHECRTGKLDEDEGLILIKQELQKLECLQTTPEEPTVRNYLLTDPDFGPRAILVKTLKDNWVVVVNEDAVTGKYTTPKMALNEYISNCEDTDFIDDFLVGVEDGRCEFGDNKYALYVEKCFNAYVFGKEL